MIINISEAKAKLSQLIDMVYHGEKVVIAKNSLPIVDLVIHQPTGIRKLGLLQDKINIGDGFLDEDEDINSMFYGDD